MTYPIPTRGALLVAVRLETATSVRVGRFVLDTGAERTMLTPNSAAQLQMVTTPGPGIWTASRFEAMREGSVALIEAVGRALQDFPVLVGQLPPELKIHGLLGLDFFRDTRLTIDFRAGLVSVT